jgi:hypothetical protein
MTETEKRALIARTRSIMTLLVKEGHATPFAQHQVVHMIKEELNKV